ncbi:MAG: NADH-quinone oxidoreductase [Legionellales bacterium]|nr:NADH-quinone oxidoreductase [Legionellales bacterium]
MIEWAQGVFAFFSGGLILSALAVVITRRPVLSVLALVGAFFCAAALWIMQGAEFLGLALIFVYVGAVMTLFLFIVMMLNQESLKAERLRRYAVPFAFICGAFLLFLLWYHAWPHVVGHTISKVAHSNTQALGHLLYTQYIFEFELAAFILLVGMIAAIALTFRGQRAGNKAVSVESQLKVTSKDRLRWATFKESS